MSLRDWSARVARIPAESALRLLVSRGSGPEFDPAGTHSIFVLRNNDLGDVLVATPLLEALRLRFPDSRIVMGVGSWAAALLENNPYVSEVFCIDAPWFNKYTADRRGFRALRFAIGAPELRRIRETGFDVGVDILGSTWGSVLLARCGIPTRLGTLGYCGGEGGFTAGVRFDPTDHVARRSLRFAELLGASELPSIHPQIFLDDSELRSGRESWSSKSLESGKRALRVVIAPGSGLPSKAWPAERFGGLVQRFADIGAEIRVVGGPREAQLGDSVAAGRATNLAGRQSLREMFATVSCADLVVCNSSVVLHVAAAFRRHAVAVLGPAFDSAISHQRQWGYDGLTISLGIEREQGKSLASVEEVIEASSRMVAEGVPWG